MEQLAASFALSDLAGAHPYLALLLVLVYPPANRIWGRDPIDVGLKKRWSGRRIVILLLVLLGIPLGYLSADVGGALVPVLFGAWRSIIIAKDWATPDNAREIALAFVRHAIPALIVSAAIGVWTVNGLEPPFEWSLVITFAAHASLSTAMAIRFTRKERALAWDLRTGRISQTECDDQIGEANATTELLQGLSFWVAVFVWTLIR